MTGQLDICHQTGAAALLHQLGEPFATLLAEEDGPAEEGPRQGGEAL